MNFVSADCATDRREDFAVPPPVVVRTESGVYTPTPSEQMYVPLLQAFNHFNNELFGGELPHCLVTIRAKGRTQGFYHAKRFAALGSKAVTDEIAMNPAYFPADPLREIAGTFVHEMTHHWQAHHGAPPRNGYHDRQWAAKMRSIGLQPSDTEAVDGRQTGYHMSHYIIENGAFALSFERLEASGWQIRWGEAIAATPAGGGEGAGEGVVGGPEPKRLKFVCPGCGQNVYGSPKTAVRCDPCGLLLIVTQNHHRSEAISL